MSKLCSMCDGTQIISLAGLTSAAPCLQCAPKKSLHEIRAEHYRYIQYGPEMLKALKDLVWQFEAAWEKAGISCSDIDRAREAIARAEPITLAESVVMAEELRHE